MYMVLVTLVDDFAAHLAKELETLGHEVVVADDGEQAFDLYRTKIPDLILVDRDHVPNVDSALVGRIRQVESLRSGAWTHIIFLTETDAPDQLVAAIQAQGDDFIAKSTSHSVLVAKLDAIDRIIQIKAQMATSRAELEHILKSVNQGIHVLDINGNIMVENDAALAMLGWDGEALIGRHAHTTMHHHHADNTPHAVIDCPIYATLHDGQIRHITDDVFWRKDGTCFPVEYIAAPLCDGFGRRYGVTVVFTDISERQRTEQELSHYRLHLEQLVSARTLELATARDQALRANQAKGVFLANMSHELRTPLNAMLGLAQLMRADATPEQLDRLGKIIGAGTHLLSILNDILDFTKIDSGQITLEHVPFAIADVLHKVLVLMEGDAKAKNLRLEMDVHDAPAHLRGDPVRLSQALLCYVGNAVKFTDYGGITLKARLAGQWDGGPIIRFEVVDTGIGLAPHQAVRLFHEFQQVDASSTRLHGGTGLGLAITQRLARLMGGDAGVESVLGQGSTFWFTAALELDENRVEPAAVAEETAVEDLLRQHSAAAKILVVEDNDINLEVALELLETVGLTADTAEDGLVGLNKAKALAYDVILMDIQMPRMDGLDATRAIRALPGSARPIIVAMTANAFDDDRKACSDAGMDDFIAKPVDAEIFYDTLWKWLKP